MRFKLNPTIFVFLLLIFAGALTAFAVPPSILTNNGAELGNLNGWTPEVTDEAWTTPATGAYAGTYSFRGGNETSTMTQTVDLLGLGYTEAQLDSITGISLSVWVKGNDDGGENDTYDVGLQMLGSGLGAMAITSLPDPHTAPAEWTQRSLGLGSYGAGMRHIRVIATTTDANGSPGNHGASFDEFVLTIADDADPTLTAVTPTDDSLGVSTRPELTLTFSEAVTVGTGTIALVQTANSIASATVDVTDDAVTGSGTNTITVSLPNHLLSNTPYHITIDEGAFVDAWSNPFAGISSQTTWNFTTMNTSSNSVTTKPVLDYSISNVHATIDSSGFTRLNWNSGKDVRYVRIFVKGEDGVTVPLSGSVPLLGAWSGNLPSSYINQEVTFSVESTDLAVRLESNASSPVKWAVEGSQKLVRSASSRTIYLIDSSNRRRPIPDEQTFFTWAKSYKEVELIDDEALVAIPLGPTLLPKAGTVLVKIQSVPDVFAIDGTPEAPIFRWITSESLAKSLYGTSWSDYVIDLPPTTWSRLSFGTALKNASDLTPDPSALRRRVDLLEN